MNGPIQPENPLVLAVDPGSTSTKFAVYAGDEEKLSENLHHPDEELSRFPTIASQAEYRLQTILSSLLIQGIDPDNLQAVVGRGGFLHAVESGVYEVCAEMVDDVKNARFGEHASNLGPILADAIGAQYHIPAYIVDPIVVDEMDDVARLSGIPDLQRKSYAHALNIRAVSRLVAETLGKPMEEASFVIAHLGSGISVVAMKNGRMVDVNNANSEGPFAVERAGGLPAYELVKLCFSGKYGEQELLRKLTKWGGVFAYLGTKDLRLVEERIARGDTYAEEILSGMVYQIAKEIGAMMTVLEGQSDGIILTGGMTYSTWVMQHLLKRISFLGPVSIVPGERELSALAQGAVRVLRGQESPKSYVSPVPLS